MSNTEDDIAPIGDGGRINWLALARKLAKIGKILAPTIIYLGGAFGGAVMAYKRATADSAGTTEVATQKTKQKSESGFQYVRKDVEMLKEHDVRNAITINQIIMKNEALEKEVSVLKQTLGIKRRVRRGPAFIPAVPIPKPTPLPKDLDQAQRKLEAQLQQKQLAPPPPSASARDASTQQ